MRYYLGQDFHGNLHLTDDVDVLDPELIFFQEINIPEKFKKNLDRTLYIDIHDISEIHSLPENY